MFLKQLIAVLLLGFAVSAGARTTDVSMKLEGGPDPYALPVARTVTSIVEYSRWPQDISVVRLCLMGTPAHADRIVERPLSRSRTLRPVSIRSVTEASGRCDVVYLGQMTLDEQRRFTAATQSLPILTIAEADPACRSRAMVCLLFEADALSFRVNLDSIARSPVRIDPRVLRLGISGAGE